MSDANRVLSQANVISADGPDGYENARGSWRLVGESEIICTKCNLRFVTKASAGFVRCTNCRYMVLVPTGPESSVPSGPANISAPTGPLPGAGTGQSSIQKFIARAKDFFADLGGTNRIGDGTGSRPNRSAYSPSDFELLCAEWMVWFGMTNVLLTAATGDGGVDVVADGVVAQSKFYSKNTVGEPAIRDLLGARTHARVPLALFFCTGGGYTDPAIRFAAQNGIELLYFDERRQRFEGVTQIAKQMCRGR